MTTTKTRRGGTALRGTIVGATATALLMGGFGAFALWSDAQLGGADGSIQTGQLALDPVSDNASWVLENPQQGGSAQPIDLATYLASPGDIISYTVTASGTVKGSDITAELIADRGSIDFDDTLVDDNEVRVTTEGADGNPVVITGTDTGNGRFSQPVTVRVEFPTTMTAGMSLTDAVKLDGFKLLLQQQ
jgi:alternate signal-mediated exported protein